VEELEKLGMTENMSIRQLELFADVYAKLRVAGKATPNRADEVQKWSLKARKARKQNPKAKIGQIVRVEHGTPRRQFARNVQRLYKSNNLTKTTMNKLVSKKWKLAVISLEEDKALNKKFRSTEFKTPEKRWDAAGIKF